MQMGSFLDGFECMHWSHFQHPMLHLSIFIPVSADQIPDYNLPSRTDRNNHKYWLHRIPERLALLQKNIPFGSHTWWVLRESRLPNHSSQCLWARLALSESLFPRKSQRLESCTNCGILFYPNGKSHFLGQGVRQFHHCSRNISLYTPLPLELQYTVGRQFVWQPTTETFLQTKSDS